MDKCGTCGSAELLDNDGEVRCLACGAAVDVPASPWGSVFGRDRFLLRRRYLTIHEKYDICDEEGRPIAYVTRPYHVRSLAALLAAFVVLGAIFAGAFLVMRGLSEAAGKAVLVVASAVGILAFVAVAYGLTPRRHVTLHRDAAGREVLLRVLQDGRFQFPTARYTVQAPGGETIARLQKNRLLNLGRRWVCAGPDGATAWVGEGRERFVIRDARSREEVGELNRKVTILDRQVLDLTADPGRRLDRRIALALVVMLDTGEGR